MPRDAFAKRTQELLALAEVQVGGGRPWDIAVHDDAFYGRVLSGGSLALGESYVDGWWDCPRLDEFFHRVLRARLDRRVRTPGWLLATLHARLVNLQAPSRAHAVGERHYDLGNDLYRAMLDPRMIYSCGYWAGASTLDEAQEAKLELVCRKLGFTPGMKVLDIGCGWGGTAKFAAERHGVEVVGITVSRRQVEFARKLCAGLPVDIRLQDYRELDGTFDRVLSLGMFEHVGCRNYRTFFETVRRRLREDGLFLLHTIGDERSETHGEPWIEKHIFPNSMLPSARQIAAAIEGVFVLEDWHNFGADYDRTLLGWCQRFDAAREELRGRYDERFRRMWRYYLLSCAGAFRARRIQLWQLVLSPRGVPGGYRRVGALRPGAPPAPTP
jgi:cyclopropane-fatty-acyl-phospholipid synthase